jgi:5-methyltetrahydrofolate--homocysteine methyltransferase
MADISEMVDAVVTGKLKQIEGLVQAAIDQKVDPANILDDGLVRGMDIIAEKWKAGQVFVPEVLRSAKTMQLGMDVLTPHLVAGSNKPKAKVAIGTVKGDLHDIGKNLVAMMLESVGYEVVNLGIDLEVDVFVNAVKDGVDAIGMSALLTTTMPQMKLVIDALEEAGIRDRVKVLVGGAPLSQDFADEIGADFFSVDAAAAVDQMNETFAG